MFRGNSPKWRIQVIVSRNLSLVLLISAFLLQVALLRLVINIFISFLMYVYSQIHPFLIFWSTWLWIEFYSSGFCSLSISCYFLSLKLSAYAIFSLHYLLPSIYLWLWILKSKYLSSQYNQCAVSWAFNWHEGWSNVVWTLEIWGIRLKFKPRE